MQLNPQLKQLVKDADFKEAPPFLFGENFGTLAKERLEAAAALTKTLRVDKAGRARAPPLFLELDKQYGSNTIPTAHAAIEYINEY